MRSPWQRRHALDPDRRYVAVATDIPPLRLSSTAAWFRGAQEVKAQLREADGVVAFTLAASPLRKRYRTLSIWTDDEAVDRFARSQAHGRLVRELEPQLAPTRFLRWSFDGRDGAPSWREGMKRLDHDVPEPTPRQRSNR